MANSFSEMSLVTLKDQKWFERQTVAGKCVGSILKNLNNIITSRSNNLNLKDLENEAIKQFKEWNCKPTFLGYKGFPGAICLSVNRELVHGIPKDYILQDGDVVKFDLGATYEGAIADAAATAIYGTPKSPTHTDLIAVCKGALDHAIKAVAIGKRLGCIGYAIHKYVNGRSRYGLITKYGGHGLDYEIPHAPPFVANKAQPTEGIRIQAGLALAIEPMVVMGDTNHRVSEDGWTVTTPDVGAHFEHSILVGEDKVHVLTDWE